MFIVDIIVNVTPLILTSLSIAFLVPYISRQRKLAKFPLLNVEQGEWTWGKARERYLEDATGLLKYGLESCSGPFRLVTDNGIKLFLPPSYVEYIKNDNRLSFSIAVGKQLHGHLPGFEPFGPGQGSGVNVDMVQKKLTKNIGPLTNDLSKEMNLAIQSQWTDNPDWHPIDLRRTVLKMVARLSSRVFVGEELCHNENWLNLSIDYTVDSFLAAKELKKWPNWSRSVVHWFLPRCRRVRTSMAKAREVLRPVLERREMPGADGGTDVEHSDAIQWVKEVSGNRKYDPVVSQVGLALAAIHTTTDLLSKSVQQIAMHPEILAEVRQEISETVTRVGWNKSGIFQMKLLDSIVKETQRLQAIGVATMMRHVTDDVTLSNGVVLPKGTDLQVVALEMRDEKVHKNANSFNPYRFYNMRQQGKESKAQLVSVTPDHLAFGYGKHACPGRFFAAHEIKIALAHILMKYDVSIIGDDAVKPTMYGTEQSANTNAKIQVRRRSEELRL